jgi:hypothetical protein
MGGADRIAASGADEKEAHQPVAESFLKRLYERVSKSFRTESIMKYTLTTINTR